MDVFTAQRPTPQQRFQTVFDAFSRRDNAAIGRANDLRAASELDENSCKPVNPYPGLRSFTPDEGTVFFGRERSVNEIRNRLADLHVAVVLGGSGSGKSSVVRAGLMPRLNSTKGIRGRPGNWYTAEFRPRTQPMEELIGAL